MNDLRAELVTIIAEIAELDDPARVTDEAHLYRDLGIDSMQALEIVLEVEKRLDVAIPEKKLREIKTLSDAMRVVQECAAAR